MKIGVRLFLSSMAFGIVIAAIYGFTTRDIVGMIFLGAMALALVIVAIFIVVAEREANLAGDQENMSPADVAGEELGAFTLESYWPILAAAGTALFLLGVVFLPGISFAFMLAGAALIAWTARFMVREST
ncbi:MAG: cytochrome c oxidase subunit 4 [Candidatus Eremiobacteraeota bacterium]|nr:cytochrome c oxidase subunit 4 [Candidatus Eremiobacteraeota bacterium]